MTSLPMIEQTAGKGARRSAARKRGVAQGADRRPRWLTYVFMSIVVLISLAPLYYTFLLASADANYISQNPIPSLIPRGNFFENVRRVFETPNLDFWGAFLRSVVVALAGAVSVVFFSTLAGFAFSKLRFRGRRGLLTFIIATMAVPTQLGVIPLYMVVINMGWLDTLLAVIVPGLVTAFGVFWMTQYLDQALPYELIEAARVDGCSMIRTFWHIALPAARPAAAMLALFTFIGSWTNFFWPFIVLKTNTTLPVALKQLEATHFKDYSLIMSGVMLATLPLIFLFVFLGRQLVSGIMAGAVKG